MAASFRSTLTAIIVAAATIPVVVLAYPAIRRISALVGAGAVRELDLVADNAARAVSYQVALLVDQAKAVAGDSDVRRGVKTVLFLERADLRLADYLRRNGAASAAYLVDLDGTVVTAEPEAMLALALPPAVAQRVAALVPAAGGGPGPDHEVVQAEAAAFLTRAAALTGTPRAARPSDQLLAVLTKIPGLVGRPGGTFVVLVPVERLVRAAAEAVGRPAAGAAAADAAAAPEVDLVDPTRGGASLLAPPSPAGPVAADGGERLITASAPLAVSPGDPAAPVFELRVSAPYGRRFAPVRRTILGLSVLVAWVVWLLGLAGYYGARLLLRPLGRLSAQADAYAEGRYRAPRPALTFPEFDAVAGTLQTMAEHILAHIEAEKARMEAELAALRAQMSPHFLFNTLNAISTTVAIDAARAEAMLARLASLYRLILEATKEATSPLARELEVATHYLELEQLRFGRRLRYAVTAPPLLGNDVRLPGLILQTLVENAVKHGVAKARQGGEVRVDVAAAAGGRYRVTVVNTGAPLTAAAGAGIGLANTVKRLDLLYQDAHGFQIGTNALGETEVTFTIASGRPGDRGEGR